MSSADIELLRDSFERLAAEGYESMVPLVHPDFVMETPPGLAAEPQRYDGPDGFRRWWTSFYEVMEEVTLVPTSYHDLGAGRVAIEGRLGAVGQTSGIEAAQTVAFVVTLHDDRMLRIDFFETLGDAKASSP